MSARPAIPQQGAALLAALLTVALLTTLTMGAMWQQWRIMQIEIDERERQQAHWLLMGAFDWARVILREDARASGANDRTDHLGEPWAIPLQEARLSDFLAASNAGDGVNAADTALTQTVYLSGRIVDEQGKLNVANLMRNGQLDPAAVNRFASLFNLLGLPPQELQGLLQGVQSSMGANAMRLPAQTFAQLTWYGLSPRALQTLSPHVTLLPEPTLVNLNTATAQVLAASVPGLSWSQAQQLVAERARQHWTSLGEFAKASSKNVGTDTHSVATQYFLVRGQLRLETVRLQEDMLLKRTDNDVRVVRSEIAPAFVQ